jgi:hypothetical protein
MSLVHDALIGHERQQGKWVEIETAPAIADKRLMIVEYEFSSPLQMMKRDGNILSRVVRDSWDSRDLATMTKNSPLKATGPHISIVGHITADELRADLDNLSMGNGFANRFLWIMSKRSKFLPFGGALDEEAITNLAAKTREAVVVAKRFEQIRFSSAAREHWKRAYRVLSEDQPGLLGALVNRAEAQVVRIAMLHALLEKQGEISVNHLKAAIALWRYADASVDYIWGEALAGCGKSRV